VSRYVYKNEQGKERFHVRKYDDKDFRVYQRTPDGKYQPGLTGVSRVPYNLPDVIDSRLVYICEGEKDADNLAKKVGITTTTFLRSNWSDDYARLSESHLPRSYAVTFLKTLTTLALYQRSFRWFEACS
jgi:hypothetical protein